MMEPEVIYDLTQELFEAHRKDVLRDVGSIDENPGPRWVKENHHLYTAMLKLWYYVEDCQDKEGFDDED